MTFCVYLHTDTKFLCEQASFEVTNEHAQQDGSLKLILAISFNVLCWAIVYKVSRLQDRHSVKFSR